MERNLRRHALRGLIVVCVFGLLSALLVACGFNVSEHPEDQVIRIGYQKFGSLSVLKARETLEKRFAPTGVKVKWIQFPAGPQLLEALNVGSIDIGHAGNAPPIFAQASGTPLVYIGVGGPRPEGEAIVVHEDSPIQNVRDLRGKKVALNKGSNVHYLLVSALEQEGLTLDDIEPVYLTPGDARPAFTNKSVDAWAIWDPYYAAAETDLHVRTIVNAEGITSNREFYFAHKQFVEENSQEVKIVLEELEKTADWINTHPDEAAVLLSEEIGMEMKPVKKAIERAKYGIEPIDPSVIKDQQNIADTFSRINLIPKKIDIQRVIWSEN